MILIITITVGLEAGQMLTMTKNVSIDTKT